MKYSVKKAANKDKQKIVSMIENVGDSFVPKVRDRVDPGGYFTYLRGKNRKYLEEKYGNKIPSPKGAKMFTIKNKDELLGFASYYKHFEPFDGAYFICIMVTPELQSNGLGKTLVQKVVDDAKKENITKMSVTTWSTNENSRRLFESNGFKLNKTVLNERAPGVHGLYLERYFSS
ncbi:GNAT family N-acetyltransferase [Patescibacteria group bacterium]|nr:GNAT family N-acetyltransferase [Patescibacteria group bacterium]